jgi:hypothetical protein
MSLLPAGLTRIERLPLTLSLTATWILENTMVSG